MSTEAPRLLTVAEAAKTLRCSRSKVFELLAAETLVRAPRYGKETVIFAESVFAACEAQYHPPPPKPPRVRPARGALATSLDALQERRKKRRG